MLKRLVTPVDTGGCWFDW